MLFIQIQNTNSKYNFSDNKLNIVELTYCTTNLSIPKK